MEKVRLRFFNGAIALGLVTTGAPALAEISLNAEDPHSAEIAEVARTTSLQVTPDVEQVATQTDAEAILDQTLLSNQGVREEAIAPAEEPIHRVQLPFPSQLANPQAEGEGSPLEGEALAQLTSVSQLSDVQPTDWAFQALQSLVERYGVIAGYPDGTFRGNRALTRYEFAAGLNAALDRIDELVDVGLANAVLQADLATLERLQQEFAEELSALRDRVDRLEARNAELAANQFSTTTRLTGEAIFAINGGTQSGVIDPNVIFFSRVRLNLETSFAGEDLLLTQLQAGSSDSSSRGVVDLLNEAAEVVETAQGINGFLQTSLLQTSFLQANSALDYSGSDTHFILNRLSYTFAASEDLNLSFFAQGFASDYVDFNRYANDSSRDFSTYGLINNQLLLANDAPGAGAAFSWNPGAGAFTLRGVYKADQAAIATASPILGGDDVGGLLNDPNLGVVELAIAPSRDFTISLQYSTGTQSSNDYDAIGANLEFALGRRVGLFGRFGYAFNFPSSIEPASWSAGLAFPDLLVPGALAGIGIGQPLIFQEDTIGLFNRTQTNYEAFYNLPLSDNVAITPVVQVITDPGNRDRSTILTGTLRTVFSF
ncbi:MAG: iron uptake porin [Leptolyngbyaceae cyanobacterium RM1_406_9]|nr:iron uptake porin [Leptolyngbyaceae cyanobacterium RM1_406_9]